MSRRMAPRGGRPEQLLPLIVMGVLVGFYILLGTRQLLGPLPPFAAYVGVAVAYAATFIDLRLGLALILVGISVSPEIGTGAIQDLRLEDLMVPAVALAWATQLILRREPLARTPLKEPIFGYLVVGLFSILVNQAVREYPLLRAGLVYAKTIDYFLIFLLVLNNVKTRREAEVFILLMLATAGLAGLYGVGTPVAQRFAGPSGEGANILGGYYAFHMVLAVGILLHVKPLPARLLLAAYAALILGTPLVRTGSRAALVALAAGLAVVFWNRKRVLLVGLAAAAALFPFLLPAPLAERVETLGAFLPMSDRSLPPAWVDRVEAWRIAFERDIFAAPVVGRGIGSHALGYVDNEYVKVLVETGFLGGAFFLWLLWKMLASARETYERGRTDLSRGFALGYLGALSALMVHALTATSFTAIRTAEPLMFATGLLGAVARIDAREKPAKEPARTPLRPVP